MILTMEQVKRLLAEGSVEVDGMQIELKQDDHFASGAEIRDFYFNGWDNNYYYEPDNGTLQIEDDNGYWILEDSMLYDLRQFGTLEWQGDNRHDEKTINIKQIFPPKYTMEFEEAFFDWKKNREYEVTINGCKCMRRSPQSYHDIVGNVPALVTVTYQHADSPTKECGSLRPGESVKIKNGTIFDAVMTDNA